MAKSNKPSDFNMFCMTVHSASATLLDIEQFIFLYDEFLHLLFWNPDVDTSIAIEQSESDVQVNGDLNG
ncbi:MAG: hypothetical protein WC504_01975 [Methylobacter sp.]